jgi:hypothetical protein
VALTSLTVTCLFNGPADAKRASAGMIAGACGLLAYCLSAPWTVKRFGALRGSLVALTAWAAGSFLVLPWMAAAPAAHAGLAMGPVGAASTHSRRSRPSISLDLGRLSEAKPKDALIRFGFGAGHIRCGWAGEHRGRPVRRWDCLGFPAILLASLTLVADEEGQSAARDDARGARAGALGLIVFAAVAATLVGRLATPIALSAGALDWLAVSVGAYAVAWLAGHGADEPPGGRPTGQP